MADIEDLDKSCGFKREMQCCNGSIDKYDVHVIVETTIASEDFPKSLAKVENQPHLVAVATALKALKKEHGIKSKVTVSNVPGTNPTDDSGEGLVDVLVYPYQVKFTKVSEKNVKKMIEDIKNECKTITFDDHIKLDGAKANMVLVCCHTKMDKRCGYCGPRLADQFLEELKTRGLGDKVTVGRTSHVGGHKYAGNVIVFPGGDWYGNVTPSWVTKIVDQHFGEGKTDGGCDVPTMKDVWRGKMGLSKDEATALVEKAE